MVTVLLALFYNMEERQQGSKESCGDCFAGIVLQHGRETEGMKKKAVVTVSLALFYNLTWKRDNRNKTQAVVTASLALFYNME